MSEATEFKKPIRGLNPKEWRKLPDTEAGPDPCVLCGTQPQAIGLHCSACWNDLADADNQDA